MTMESSRYEEYLEKKARAQAEKSTQTQESVKHPWSEGWEPQSLSELLEAIADYNRRFVYYEDETKHSIIALWVAHTYVYGRFTHTPRLYINAPEPGCGKSTQAKVLAHMSKDGHLTSGTSAASVFRRMNQDHPTYVLDEVDTIWNAKGRDNEDLRQAINAGHEAGGAIDRIVGDEMVPVSFDVFGPMALSGINNTKLPPTLEDRSIPLRMNKVNGIRLDRFKRIKEDHFKDMLHEWMPKFLEDMVVDDDMYAPEHLSNRDWDNWLPLFAIAEVAEGDWPKRAFLASEAFKFDAKVSDNKAYLLFTYRFMKERGLEKVQCKQIAEAMKESGDATYATARAVSSRLSTYDIKTSRSNGVSNLLFTEVEAKVRVWAPEAIDTPEDAPSHDVHDVHYMHSEEPESVEPVVTPPTQKPSLSVPAVPVTPETTESVEPVVTPPSREHEPGKVLWETTREIARREAVAKRASDFKSW